MTTAAIYLRVSTEEQGDNFSLPSQRRECEVYCADKGYDVIGEYVDTFTGTTLDRPALNKLLDRIDDVNVLVVYAVSRLSREPADLLYLHKQLVKQGVRVEFVNEAIDATTDTGEAMLYFFGFAAREYRKAMLEAVRRGKREKVRGGKVMPLPFAPYGYDYDEETEMYVINREEARIVRQIFEWYVNGDESGKHLSYANIAKRLTEMGIPTRMDTTGHTKRRKEVGVWHSGTVQKMLRRELYAGVWKWGEGKGKSKRKDYLTVNVPPIVSRELFEQVALVAARNQQRSVRRTNHFYLMQKRLTCANCGRSMGAHTKFMNGKHYQYYRCSGVLAEHSPDGMTPTCPLSINVRRLDTAAWNTLCDMLRDPEGIYEGLIEKYNNDYAALETLRQEETAALQQQEDARQRLERLMDLYLDGRYTKAVLDDKEAEWREKLRIADATLSRVRKRLNAAKTAPPDLNALQQSFAAITQKLPTLSDEGKRSVIDLFEAHGLVAQDRQSMLFRISIETFDLEWEVSL